MEKSTIFHNISIITGIWGLLALNIAWLVGEIRQYHYYGDAIVLTLISISAGICAMYRRQLEKEAH